MTSALFEVTPRQLQEIRNEPDKLASLLRGKDVARCDLGSRWQQIEFLFERTWPGSRQARLVRGTGTIEVAAGEVGYGYVDPATIKELGSYFSRVGPDFVEELLRSRYNRDEMVAAGIYHAELGDFGSLWLRVERLCELVSQAAGRGNAVICQLG